MQRASSCEASSLSRLYLQLPEPDQYLVYQQALASDVADALRELARDSLCHALISTFDTMQAAALTVAAVATPAAGCSSPTTVATGPAAFPSTASVTAISESALHRQLIRFNVMLRSNLLSFVVDSASEWTHYMLRAMEEKFDPVLQHGAAAAPAAAAAGGFRVKGSVPCLLQLNIVLSEGLAVFHPTPEEQVELPYCCAAAANQGSHKKLKRGSLFEFMLSF